MKTILAAVVVLFSAVSFAASSGPDTRTATNPKSILSQTNPSAKPIPIDDLYMTKSVGGGAWSPDGKEILFDSNASGRLNLWKMNADGSHPTQMLHSDDRQTGAAWSPDGKSIVYAQDKGGNEIWDLYVVQASGGEPQDLTNTDTIAENNPLWSPDGSRIAVTYKPKQSPIRDIAILDWNTKQVRNLTNEKEQDKTWGAVAWTHDGKQILATRGNDSFTDSDVYLVDVDSGKTENLTTHSGTQLNQPADISPDGKLVLMSSNRDGGYFKVGLLDVGSKKIRWVTDSKWETSPEHFSPDGKSFGYSIDQDGRTEAFLANTATGQAHKIQMPEGLTGFSGNPTPFSPDGKKLLMSHQSSRRPGDLWSYTITTAKPVQLTHSANPSVVASSLPQSQLVHYKSFDGTMISAFVWVPFNLKRDGKNAAIVLPHGGPTGQTVDSFNRQAAALATHGYICIAPNVRGSTGYGQKFQEMNVKDLGGGDLQDEVYGVKFLEATGYADSKKIGITGGSYGGYMTLMAIGKTPNVWSAAVEEYGIINWLTMLQHEDAFLQQYERGLLGDPEKDKKIYEQDSPLAYIRQEKAPLLVLQGENDPRVPKEEAEQVVDILKKEGRTVDVHYYPNEGHGFAKREDQIDAMKRTLDWFDKYLHGSGGSAAGK
ncbi:MAG TPA: S9 family peptidase [Terriglobales bacterium]|nr:S9 family peptidase [Terriglobales bacterium]